MTVDKSFLIKKIQKRETMLVAYCGFTGMPLVVCDPETFNDQVWIFETEALLQEFAKKYTEKKILLRGIQYKNDQFLRFFSSLFTMGINELVFVDEGATTTIELEELVKRPDYSKMKPQERPITNPELQLTGMYFMQEASRPVPNEEKENLKDLEEELAANMVKSRYIIGIELNEGPESDDEKLKSRKYKLPILKNKEGEILQPIFTDPLEFQKFAKGKAALKAIAVPYSELAKLLVKDAKGYMLNPGGYHILMPRELLVGLSKRFQ
ncbi:MAG: SseB family protein [Lachnospiraceae bacterium]|nr:SseB family protein [Lachnospiraceae bacterium]